MPKPTTALSKKPAAQSVDVEIVADNKAMDLETIAQGIAAEQEQMDRHMSAAKDAMLPHALRIGLYCLQAQQVLLIPNDGSRNKGKNQHSTEVLSEADKTSPEAAPTSFSAWLARPNAEVNRANAYNYMKAVKGLGLTHEADVKQLDKALSKARKEAGTKKLSIARLAHNAPAEESSDQEQVNTNTEEDKAAESRLFITDWIAKWDLGEKAGNLEHADKEALQTLEEFLSNTRGRIAKRLRTAK